MRQDRLPSHPYCFCSVGSRCEIRHCVTRPQCDRPPSAMEMHKSTGRCTNQLRAAFTKYLLLAAFDLCPSINSPALVREAASSLVRFDFFFSFVSQTGHKQINWSNWVSLTDSEFRQHQLKAYEHIYCSHSSSLSSHVINYRNSCFSTLWMPPGSCRMLMLPDRGNSLHCVYVLGVHTVAP